MVVNAKMLEIIMAKMGGAGVQIENLQLNDKVKVYIFYELN